MSRSAYALLIAALCLVGVACGERSTRDEATGILEGSAEVGVESVVAAAPEAREPDPGDVLEKSTGIEPLATDVLGQSVVADSDELEVLAAHAHDHLVGLGRSEPFASCVVERLVAIGAIDVLEDPRLGVGASPVEADALAACL